MADSVDERRIRLVEKLLEKTNARSIAWRVVSDTAFDVPLSGGGVEVSLERGKQNLFRLRIFDRSGNVVDEFIGTEVDTDTIPVAFTTTFGRANLNPLMRDLFNNARRSALNSDEVIDGILRDLQ